ncbi:archaetidylserine decarboxylase [Synoicihabitans lomoniglobus]|uniref:phosphatidylserine decarboxylase n=1 Tax=Synoicihabitans lomoniglobus TaxID=2909285 RepID=A0AAF0CP24_9BACT|nr:archaetidylserine decarboxylase [Opitutaceae bacterium LMO-M01]WED65285.1 archaetidylserine decarboxylase [Opitutaceae bacterium LMO-M01]
MASTPVQYFNRYTQQLETEQIYGERWLRWAYESGLGRATTAVLLKRWFFSWYYGHRMNRKYSGNKVLPFVVDYDLDADEFGKQAWEYKTFNEFFARALKPAARPIAAGDDVAVLPADGRHLAFADVDAAEGFYVKGSKFTLAELFGSAELAAPFAGGTMVISRLCPVDYHRFHFPVAGTPDHTTLIKGALYSVNPIALRRNVKYLVQNKRMRTLLDSERFGQVAMFEVGATCVGTIRQLYVPDRVNAKGEEKGLFKFGGSCVITVFQAGRIELAEDLKTQGAQQREVYARMGDVLGRATTG